MNFFLSYIEVILPAPDLGTAFTLAGYLALLTSG